MNSRMLLHNETAIVTGGTSGIGKKITEILLKEGCKVSICSRNEAHIRATLEEFKVQYGDSIIGYVCDVADPADVEKFVNNTTATFGSLRILIANAGINLSYGPFEYLPLERMNLEAKTVLDTNLIGTMNIISAILPQMKKQKYGRIITLSGGGADRPIDNMTLYSASKGGILAFSRCLALELRKCHPEIKLNIFQPGMQKTGLTTTPNITPGWEGGEKVLQQLDIVIEFMGGNIEESCRKIIPYVRTSCKKNAYIIRGSSMLKILVNLPKMIKALKK